MQPRQRNGRGNGYRGNAMRMGSVGVTTQISSQGSMRGRQTYDSEYRAYSRGGYGRGGHWKQFQPALPPPPETDIFMEAGKLAAEYLVSKGVLPPNVLSGKWQHDGFKKHMGNFVDFRPREVENAQIPVDDRASAHSHLGNTTLDVELGRRRYSDEYNPMGTKNFLRGRRTVSFKNYGSGVNRELGKSGSWTERSSAATCIKSDNDALAGHHDEQHVGKDGCGGEQNSSPGQITQEVRNVDHLESESEKHNSVEDAGARSSSFSNEAHLPSDVNGESAKESADANKINADFEAVKEGGIDNDLDKKNDKNKEVIATAREDSLVSEGHVDLVKHIKFVNVPTKARSSLTIKASKRDQDSMNEDESISESEISKVSGVHAMDVQVDSSNGHASSHENHESESLQSDPAAPVEEEPIVKYTTEQGQCLRSESFPETSVYMGQELDDTLSGSVSSNSILFMDEGRKRAIDDNTDGREDFKKLKEWVPSMDVQSHGSPPHFGSLANEPTLQGSAKSSFATLSDDHSISLFPRGHADSCEFMEEKQLFPGLFKTCDLNLVGTFDVNENHGVPNPVRVLPPVAETRKEAVHIDVDLSMSNNCHLPNKNGKYEVNDNGIEIIDLDYESAQEDKSFSNSHKRGDTLTTDLDGFHSNVHNSNEIPDVQDGFGLMISELLGNSSPNSSAPTGLNSLHNHMGLPIGEGILGDDDSIYMSLGEIPISLLGAWEQPTQDYGKPF